MVNVPSGDRSGNRRVAELGARRDRGVRDAERGPDVEQALDLSIADVALEAACSFATAWQAAQDYRLLRAAGRDGGRR
jgi:hypothetical protein